MAKGSIIWREEKSPFHHNIKTWKESLVISLWLTYRIHCPKYRDSYWVTFFKSWQIHEAQLKGLTASWYLSTERICGYLLLGISSREWPLFFAYDQCWFLDKWSDQPRNFFYWVEISVTVEVNVFSSCFTHISVVLRRETTGVMQTIGCPSIVLPVILIGNQTSPFTSPKVPILQILSSARGFCFARERREGEESVSWTGVFVQTEQVYTV